MDNLQLIQSKIYEIRGRKVMLDRDFAELYQVTTGNLNKAVQRNIKRFPPDFMFQLTKEEFDELKGNSADLNKDGVVDAIDLLLQKRYLLGTQNINI